MKEGWRDGIFLTSNLLHPQENQAENHLTGQAMNSYYGGVGNSSDYMGGKITTWLWTTVSFAEECGQGHLCLVTEHSYGKAGSQACGRALVEIGSSGRAGVKFEYLCSTVFVYCFCLCSAPPPHLTKRSYQRRGGVEAGLG